MVSQAGWIPVYDVRSDDINGPVELSYKAKVYQNTGYDWDKVMLHLNTGNPTVSGTQPTVEPWVLQMYDPIADAKRREANRRYREEAERKKAAEGRAVASNSSYTLTTTGSDDGNVATAPQGGTPGYTYSWDFGSTADFTNMTESNVSTEFKIKVPYTIKTDGKKYDVEVARHDLPVEYNYFSVPKIDDDAFLIARVSGWDAYNLLPGTANIYYQGHLRREFIPRYSKHTRYAGHFTRSRQRNCCGAQKSEGFLENYNCWEQQESVAGN